MNKNEPFSLNEDEQFWSTKIVNALQKTLDKKYSGETYQRFFHPKMHGILKAEIKIHDNIPDDLKIGIFAKPSNFPAWIRISNASKKISDDSKKSYRGFALKLMNVEGLKVLPGHEHDTTHDFIFANSPVFAANSLKAAAEGVLAVSVDGILKKIWFALTHISMVLQSMKIPECFNLLEQQYWSQAPFLYGEKHKVKYTLIPCKPKTSIKPDFPTIDFLRDQLELNLSKDHAYFDFCIQLYENEKVTPIENTSVEWKTKYIKLATLKILKQEFSSPKQRNFGQNISFNPGRSLHEHQPIGGISKARVLVYKMMSDFRHKINNTPNTEPNYPESFKQFDISAYGD